MSDPLTVKQHLAFFFFFLLFVRFVVLSPVTFVLYSDYEKNTVKLQWLEHLLDHENMFEKGVVRANDC